VTQSKPDTPARSEPSASPGVRHDSRGHAVWQWAADTARNVAVTTSQVLRRLDHQGLSLQDETSKSKAARPGAGFNPYEGRQAPQAKAKVIAKNNAQARVMPKSRSPASAPSRSSWWRRLFGRG
jgi:hypothetical protein